MMFARMLGYLMVGMVLVTACGREEPVVEASGPAAFDAVLIELFGTDDTDAYLASIEQDAAEFVASCMADAGFEFQIPDVATSVDPPDPTDLEDAQLRGFGIIEGFKDGVRQTDLTTAQGQDPNVAYVSGLPQAEFDRFFFTLDGAEPEPGQRREGGCNGQASEETYGNWLRFSETLPNYTAMGEERDTHPDWVAARQEWKVCMTSRGFDYSEPDAIRSDVVKRMRDTVSEVYPTGQVPLVIVDGVAEVDPAVDVILDELIDFEIQAAVANVECTEPLANQFDAVERIVQQDFVDRNQATIDELLLATE